MNNRMGYEFPASFIRQGAFPLDESSIFNSLEEAKQYVNNNPIAYIGQPFSVVNKEEQTVELYIVGFSGTIIQISKITSINGDDKSIILKNGKLSLLGFDLIQSEGLSVRTKADGNGGYVLEWFDLNTSLNDFNKKLTVIEAELKTKVAYSDIVTEEQMQGILDEIFNSK